MTISSRRVGVVFDCDGVLADTNSCWDAAFTAAAHEFGLELDDERLSRLHGAALGTAAGELARWSPRPLRPDDVRPVLVDRLVSAIGAADLVLPDGLGDLLDRLHGVVPLGVASNSPRSVLRHVLARSEIAGYFTVTVSADDVPRPKPAPDPYLAACEALGIDPPAGFAVEDSETGIRSAVAAGLTVIEVTGPGRRPAPGHGSGSALRVATLADPRVGSLIVGTATRQWNEVRNI
jgi:HAD superfamily hydrolase (TIGR01509 family)